MGTVTINRTISNREACTNTAAVQKYNHEFLFFPFTSIFSDSLSFHSVRASGCLLGKLLGFADETWLTIGLRTAARCAASGAAPAQPFHRNQFSFLSSLFRPVRLRSSELPALKKLTFVASERTMPPSIPKRTTEEADLPGPARGGTRTKERVPQLTTRIAETQVKATLDPVVTGSDKHFASKYDENGVCKWGRFVLTQLCVTGSPQERIIIVSAIFSDLVSSSLI